MKIKCFFNIGNNERYTFKADIIDPQINKENIESRVLPQLEKIYGKEIDMNEPIINGNKLEIDFSCNTNVSGFNVFLPQNYPGLTNVQIISASENVRINCTGPRPDHDVPGVNHSGLDVLSAGSTSEQGILQCSEGYSHRGEEYGSLTAICPLSGGEIGYSVLNSENCVLDCREPSNSNQYLDPPDSIPHHSSDNPNPQCADGYSFHIDEPTSLTTCLKVSISGCVL